MHIQEVYTRFCLPKTLQEHMIRVAAVTEIMIQHWKWPYIDTKRILLAALLHDLWNIVKMDFSLHKDWYGHSFSYRQQKKEETIQTYWTACHEATIAMVRELGVGDDVIAIIDHMGVRSFMEEEGPWETMFVRYADMRVNPWSIVWLDERMHEAHERYKKTAYWAKEPLWTTILQHAHEQEANIFQYIDLLPEQITEQSTKTIQGQLWEFVF